MSLVEVVGVCVALVVVVVLVFVVFDFVVFCIFIMMTKTETRAAAMTAPSGIVDGHLVAAGDVTFSDTLLPMPEPEPEEMPPLAPPSAEVGCTPKTPSPPPKAPTATSGKGRRWVALPSEPVAEAGRPPERPEPLLDSPQWEAMKAVIIAKNDELSYKENIIKNMGQELKEKDQELEDKEKRIKNMIQELRLKNASIHAINEEFEEQQAPVKVWEQEVTIGDMAIGVVVRKKRKITVDTS